jgi:hypothetical protein
VVKKTARTVSHTPLALLAAGLNLNTDQAPIALCKNFEQIVPATHKPSKAPTQTPSVAPTLVPTKYPTFTSLGKTLLYQDWTKTRPINGPPKHRPTHRPTHRPRHSQKTKHAKWDDDDNDGATAVSVATPVHTPDPTRVPTPLPTTSPSHQPTPKPPSVPVLPTQAPTFRCRIRAPHIHVRDRQLHNAMDNWCKNFCPSVSLARKCHEACWCYATPAPTAAPSATPTLKGESFSPQRFPHITKARVTTLSHREDPKLQAGTINTG